MIPLESIPDHQSNSFHHQHQVQDSSNSTRRGRGRTLSSFVTEEPSDPTTTNTTAVATASRGRTTMLVSPVAASTSNGGTTATTSTSAAIATATDLLPSGSFAAAVAMKNYQHPNQNLYGQQHHQQHRHQLDTLARHRRTATVPDPPTTPIDDYSVNVHVVENGTAAETMSQSRSQVHRRSVSASGPINVVSEMSSATTVPMTTSTVSRPPPSSSSTVVSNSSSSGGSGGSHDENIFYRSDPKNHDDDNNKNNNSSSRYHRNGGRHRGGFVDSDDNHNNTSHSSSSGSSSSDTYDGRTDNAADTDNIINKENNNSNQRSIVVSTYSNQATKCIEQGNYRQAFEYYQLALKDYMAGSRSTTENNDGEDTDDCSGDHEREHDGRHADPQHHRHLLQTSSSLSANTDSVRIPHRNLDSSMTQVGDRTSVSMIKKMSSIPDGLTVVELVNAAASCFNLGALAKKLKEYETAAMYFRKAQDMYERSSVIVFEHYHQTQSKAAKELDIDHHTSILSSLSLSYSCEVCLLQLLVETLQARAHLHQKYQNRVDDAIACHEQVIEILSNDKSDEDIIDLDVCDEERQQRQSENDDRGKITDHDPLHNHSQRNSNHQIRRKRSLECDTVYHKIHFTTLAEEARSKLLLTSLQTVGKFFVERGKLDDAMIVYSDTLSVLEKIQSSSLSSESIEEKRDEIVQILEAIRNVSNRNKQKKKKKKSHTHLEKHAPAKKHDDIVEMERLAVAEEQAQNWEGALHYRELVLICLSQKYGEESIQVADALMQMARVMIFDGNPEGALDLYHAASNIYLKDSTGVAQTGRILPRFLFTQTLQLYKDLDQHANAIPWLRMLLSRCQGIPTEEAMIHYEIARICVDLGHLQAAYDELSVSSGLCDRGTNSDEKSEVLRLVESLRLQIKEPVRTAAASSPLTAITEDGESAVAMTEDSESRLTALSEDVFDIDGTKSLNAILGKDENDHELEPELLSVKSPLGETFIRTEADRLDALVSQASHALVDDSSYMHKPPAELSDLSSSLVSPDPCKPKNTDSVVSSGNNTGTSHPTDEGGTRVGSSTPADKAEGPSIEDDNQDRRGYNDNVSADYDDCGSYDADNDDDGGYESFPEKNRSIGGSEEPVNTEASNLHIFGPGSGIPSPTKTPNSTTGLLEVGPQGKSATSQQQKSLSLPNLGSPKHKNKSRGRKGKGYEEVFDNINEDSKEDGQRRTFVQALASPFRRSRSKTRLVGERKGLATLDEDREVGGRFPSALEKPVVDEDSMHSTDAPVAVINAPSKDDDMSLVSQITFRMDEIAPRTKTEDRQWWWGVSSDEFDGWFPSTYVNKALEAAEGFLSAKAIHVKSRPLDFYSDDESEAAEEDYSLLRESSSRNSKIQSSTAHISKTSENESKTKQTPESSYRMISPSSRGGSGSLNPSTLPRNSQSSKNQSLESQIAEAEETLESLKLKASSQDAAVGVVQLQLANLYRKANDTNSAINASRDALVIQSANDDALATWETLYLMADIHADAEQYQEALSCLSEAQRAQEESQGHYSEEVAVTLNKIGNIWTKQSEFDAAMESHKNALLVLKECCGEDINHPRVCDTMIEIGNVYYKERNSLQTNQAKMNSHSSTLVDHGMLATIGRCHEKNGFYKSAISFFLEKLQFLKEENGSDSSGELEEVAETLNSLGMLSSRAGLYIESIDYYDRALTIQNKLGCDDASIAMAKVLVGSVHFYLGRIGNALNLFEGALRVLLEQVGPEHETVAATLYYMGIARAARCEYDIAISNLTQALQIQSQVLGDNHPASLRTRREIGNMMRDNGSEGTAQVFEDIILAQKAIHGEKHPNIADTLHSLARSHKLKDGESEQQQQALALFIQSYNMRLKFLPEHPNQATTLLEMADIHCKLGSKKSLRKAMRFIDAAIAIRIESLGEHHVDVAMAVAMKGACYVASGQFNDAKVQFTKALPEATAAVGKDHPSVAWIHTQMAEMFARQCLFDEAKESIDAALRIYVTCHENDDHPSLRAAIEVKSNVERAELLCV